MTFIDASVIVAILKPEPDADAYIERLQEAAGPLFISPLIRYEASVSLARARARPTRGAPVTPEMISLAHEAVDYFVQDLDVREIEISSAIGKTALEAAAAYGKAVGHRARLNFGDCFAYACAKTLGASLLYKGDDFAQTDMA